MGFVNTRHEVAPIVLNLDLDDVMKQPPQQAMVGFFSWGVFFSGQLLTFHVLPVTRHTDDTLPVFHGPLWCRIVLSASIGISLILTFFLASSSSL